MKILIVPCEVPLPGGYLDCQSGFRLCPIKPPELPTGWVVSASLPQSVGGVEKEALPIDIKKQNKEVPMWCSRLRIWHCRRCCTGHNCSMGFDPWPGNSHMLWVQYRGGKKKKKKKKERTKSPKVLNRHWDCPINPVVMIRPSRGCPCFCTASNSALLWYFASSRCHLLKPSFTYIMTYVCGRLQCDSPMVPLIPLHLIFPFPGSLLFFLYFPSLCDLLVE